MVMLSTTPRKPITTKRLSLTKFKRSICLKRSNILEQCVCTCIECTSQDITIITLLSSKLFDSIPNAKRFNISALHTLKPLTKTPNTEKAIDPRPAVRTEWISAFVRSER